MKPKLIVSIALTLLLAFCGFNSANASMTVNEVEQLITVGDYEKAEKELKTVLKEHPDSIVAHKYMIEVLKLKHASTLEYSVQYKLHEQEILRITEDIENNKRAENFKEAFYMLLIFLSMIIICAISFYLPAFIKRRRAEKAKQEEINEWYKNAKNECVNYSILINSALIDSKNGEISLSSTDKDLLEVLATDHDDVVNCIDNKDINKDMYIIHIRDVKNFLVSRGIASEKDFY